MDPNVLLSLARARRVFECIFLQSEIPSTKEVFEERVRRLVNLLDRSESMDHERLVLYLERSYRFLDAAAVCFYMGGPMDRITQGIAFVRQHDAMQSVLRQVRNENDGKLALEYRDLVAKGNEELLFGDPLSACKRYLEAASLSEKVRAGDLECHIGVAQCEALLRDPNECPYGAALVLLGRYEIEVARHCLPGLLLLKRAVERGHDGARGYLRSALAPGG
jgi:hypothetical protein